MYEATKKSMYSDQTGRLPITSAQGHKYIMVTVELDGNYLDAKAMTYAQCRKPYQSLQGNQNPVGCHGSHFAKLTYVG